MNRLIIANWKMHMTASEGVAFVRALSSRPLRQGRQVAIAPPFTMLASVCEAARAAGFITAAQNMHFEEKGAFTGECSPLHLRDAGATHVIIGHSERRHLFGETDDIVARKMKAAADHGLTPVCCVGELLEERQAGATSDVIARQVAAALSLLDPAWQGPLVIAYEPVWAIGTGVTATPDQAEKVHDHIARLVEKTALKTMAGNVTILYGGSVTPDNATSLMAKPSIHGALVGGASLKVDAFEAIINA